MYPKNIQAKLNRVLQNIHRQDRTHLNCIRLENTDALCWSKIIATATSMKIAGIPFLTQARILDGGGRIIGKADLITPLDLTAYEFMNTETDERFEAKNYEPFKKVSVKINRNDDWKENGIT